MKQPIGNEPTTIQPKMPEQEKKSSSGEKKHEPDASTGAQWSKDPFEDDVTAGDVIKNQTPNKEEYKS